MAPSLRVALAPPGYVVRAGDTGLFIADASTVVENVVQSPPPCEAELPDPRRASTRSSRSSWLSRSLDAPLISARRLSRTATGKSVGVAEGRRASQRRGSEDTAAVMRASREEAGGEDDTEAEAEAAAPAPAAAAAAPVSAATAAMFRRASGSPNAQLGSRPRPGSVTFGADVAATELEVNARQASEGSSSDAPIAVTDVGVVGDGDGEPAGRVSSGGVGSALGALTKRLSSGGPNSPARKSSDVSADGRRVIFGSPAQGARFSQTARSLLTAANADGSSKSGMTSRRLSAVAAGWRKAPTDAEVDSYMKTASLEQRKAARRIDRKGSLADLLRNTVAQVVERRALKDAALFVDYHRTVPLSGHIVLVCTTLRDLVHFVAPLRQPTVQSKPIVLLCPLSPKGTSSDLTNPSISHDAQAAWEEISQFADVHVLDGERNLARDLIRAGIRRADNVVVLSGKGHPEQPLAAMDAEVILATLEAEKRCEVSTRILSEVHNGNFSDSSPPAPRRRSTRRMAPRTSAAARGAAVARTSST